MTSDPAGNDPPPPSAKRAAAPCADALAAMADPLAPGDWVHVAYQGREVLGMIDRVQEGLCTFAYWEAGRLRFGSVAPDAIRAREPRLTAQFRAAIAVDPHYVSKYLAQWTAPAAPPPPDAPPARRRASRWVQLRLFPD